MEAISKKRALLPSSARPAAMAMHRASHAIAKPKPKIRIIHIFAPEIIKTDVANFRELVQRLTGKPTEKNPAETPAAAEEVGSIVAFDDQKPEITSIAAGLRSERRRSVKKEEDEEENDVVGMWNGGGGGYFGGFSDLDLAFIEELGGEFPLLPLPPAHQIMHGFEETQFVA